MGHRLVFKHRISLPGNGNSRFIVQIEGNVHVWEVFRELSNHLGRAQNHPSMSWFDTLLNSSNAVTNANRTDVIERVSN